MEFSLFSEKPQFFTQLISNNLRLTRFLPGKNSRLTGMGQMGNTVFIINNFTNTLNHGREAYVAIFYDLKKLQPSTMGGKN